MSLPEDGRTIGVLDKGYVRYERHMGDDLGVVNDLRASMMKRTGELRETDKRLLKRCFRRREFSAWRHHVITLEIKAPLMVARQLYKYSVASAQREDQFGWNEASRRYVTLDVEFYEPEEWRSAPTQGVKQGSGPPVSEPVRLKHAMRFGAHAANSLSYYQEAIDDGICVEQARGYLPAYFLYTTWHWTMSLNALCLVLFERIPESAQLETQAYAHAIKELAYMHWPLTMEAVDDFLFNEAVS